MCFKDIVYLCWLEVATKKKGTLSASSHELIVITLLCAVDQWCTGYSSVYLCGELCDMVWFLGTYTIEVLQLFVEAPKLWPVVT